MKFSLLSENINKKLPFISHAVSNRSQLTALLNFLITAKGKELSVSATDLEIGIIGRLPAGIEEDGETSVPARTLLELLGNIPNGKIDVYTKENTLFIETPKTKMQLQTQPTNDFPLLYEKKGEEIIEVEKELLEKELKKVVFASSLDSSRPALSGVLIGEKGGDRIIVATDGYRLSFKKIAAGVKKKTGGLKKTILVPSRILRELISLKEEGSVKVCVSSENNQVVFSQGDMEVVGRLIEAEFPAYEKIIPSDFSAQATFDRQEMHGAVKTCWVFARETSGIIRMAIGKNKITVSSSTPSVGQGSVEVEARVEGEENEIAFNGRYLLELLSNIDEEDMVFEMTGPLNAGVFKIAGDSSFLHLIMPIRVQE
ncbi:MAG: DNA polymerase III subunit beta [Candidatus Levybacteria bacterium]|nr:DNA polymerase III subunit beta [Candidatus Levybacteria bacterium]